jgi:hypothetical protein
MATIAELEKSLERLDDFEEMLEKVVGALEKPATAAPVERNSEGYAYIAAAIFASVALFMGHQEIAITAMTAAGLYGVGRTGKKIAETVINGKAEKPVVPNINLDLNELLSGGMSVRDAERLVKSVTKEMKGWF